MTTPEIEKVWKSYSKTRSIKLRNKLVVHYLYLVPINASKLHRKVPSCVCYDDLLGAGHLGLIRAVENFNLNRNVKFECFAGTRIYGSMIDWIRSTDHRRRMLLEFDRQVSAIEFQHSLLHDTELTDEQIASKINRSVKSYKAMKREVHFSNYLSLSCSSGIDEEERRSDKWHTDHTAPDPSDGIGTEFMQELIKKKLSKQESIIVILYFWKERSMKQIGDLLKLSESRVSQLLRQSLMKIKSLELFHPEELAA